MITPSELSLWARLILEINRVEKINMNNDFFINLLEFQSMREFHKLIHILIKIIAGNA